MTKLSDANDAGTRNSHLCTLILTEGDSAKSLAMSGLSVVGHDHWGVFPLRCVCVFGVCRGVVAVPAAVPRPRRVPLRCHGWPAASLTPSPLNTHDRGKLLNVRDATALQISENAEIQHIKQILGLQHGKAYDDVKALRYGHLMIMTDQVGRCGCGLAGWVG